MYKKIDYFEYFNSALEEKGVSISKLEKEKILTYHTFYNYKDYSPSLKNAIKIANYLEMSLDYIMEKTSENKFHKYKLKQSNFHSILIKMLKEYKLSQYQFCKESKIGTASISRWKNGAVPKFSKVYEISNFLKCNIDDLLETE